MTALGNEICELDIHELDIVNGGVVQIQSMSTTIETPGSTLPIGVIGGIISAISNSAQKAAHNSGRPPA
jgi:hypothetical protein